MTDPNKNSDYFNMVEQEINCTLCGNYMGHIMIKKEGQTDDQLVEALNVFSKFPAIEQICPTCWITKVKRRDDYRIDESKR